MLVLGSTVVESIESVRFSVFLLLLLFFSSVRLWVRTWRKRPNSNILFSHFLSNYLFIHSGVLNGKGNFNCVLDAVMYTSVAYAENHKATSTRRCFPTSVPGKLLRTEIKKNGIHQQSAPEQIIINLDCHCHISNFRSVSIKHNPKHNQRPNEQKTKICWTRASAYHISRWIDIFLHINHKTLFDSASARCRRIMVKMQLNM